jgi:uncharacterized protein (DUF2336 family)
LAVSSPIVAELEAAIGSGSPEKRVEVLRRVTDLFLKDADRLNDQQIAIFDDVLLHLIQRIETKALVQLSSALAPVDNAPIEVIQGLARHDEISIAGPVLRQSSRLSDVDLVEIANSKSQAHLLALSTRASLSEAVTDVLVKRGNDQVAHSLVRNSGALLSEAGFSHLVKQAETDESLAEKLGLRLDIPLSLLRQLLQKATNAVRARLLASSTAGNQENVQRALASIANEVGREAGAPRDFRRSGNLVDELNRKGKLNETVLMEFTRTGRYEEMASTLALFCQAPVDMVETLMKNPRVDGVVLVCKAARVSWATARAVLGARFAHHSISEAELQAAKEAFFELTQAAAQRTLRFMAVQHTTTKKTTYDRGAESRPT